MKNSQAKSFKWAYMPIVFSSAAILVSTVTAAPSANPQYQDAKQVSSINHEYVGGGTQLGISVTDDGDVGLEINQVISEGQNSSTSVGLWGDYDLDDDNKGLQGRGGQVNHNWVSRDKAGRATHVNKVTAAYARNADGHDKATVGYGQENESRFWDVHASKGLSGSKSVGNNISEKSYDYGVGAGVGTFIKGSNVRVRAGLDHEWGDDVSAGESTARNTTLSAGVEKFFQNTPHSLALDVAASTKSGGYDNGSDDTDISGRATYRYDFGGASIYQPDRRYKRVRVEIPGKAVAAQYKSVATYEKKTVKKAYKQLIKSTVALEGQTFFKLNSHKLIPSAQSRLKQIATEIRKNGYKGSIRITGNTCGLGDVVYDQKLSERRANEVRAFLIKNGFNADHLIARGLGKGHPKYPNTPEQGFKNRRVDIEYVSEHKSYKTGYRSEVQNVRTGTKNVLIAKGKPGTPRVIWRTEVVPTAPAWIKRAMHNNITIDRNVNTYLSTPTPPTPVDPEPPCNMECTIAHPDYETTNVNEAVNIDVLDNDSGIGLEFVSVDNPQNGTAVIVGNIIRYTPDSGFTGTDKFWYDIKDAKGYTTSSWVEVTVVETTQVNREPDAVEDSLTISIGKSVLINVLENDTDPDDDNLTIKSIIGRGGSMPGGIAKMENGQIRFTSNGTVGSYSFYYEISDGHGGTDVAGLSIGVTDPNDPNYHIPTINGETVTAKMGETTEIDVLANDIDDDGDTLTLDGISGGNKGTFIKRNNKIYYTPNAGSTGTDIIWYGVNDGRGRSNSGTLTINIIN